MGVYESSKEIMAVAINNNVSSIWLLVGIKPRLCPFTFNLHDVLTVSTCLSA